MKIGFSFIILLLLFSCNKTGQNHHQNTAEVFYQKAKQTDSDSAFYYFNLAKNSYLEASDSTGVGRSLVNMAILQHNQEDYYGSLETSAEANRFLRKTEDSIVRSTLASNYNNMGICFSFLYDFNNSVKYYKLALQYVNVPTNRFMYYNNLGDVLITLGKYKEAQENLKKSLQTKDTVKYAKFINNFARAKYYENPEYNPLPEFYRALEIRKANNDTEGENSSYATLSIYFSDKNKEKALDYAKKMLQAAVKNESKEDQMQALQKLIILDPGNYLNYFKKFQTLNDQVQAARSNAKNQFAVVRYDVEQKNAQNQRLQAQSFKQYVGIASLIIVLVAGFFWNEKRKKNIRREKEQEKQLEVKNTELKYSKKVHDVVANGLYHMMTDIENNPELNKIKLLNDMEKMYEESRDISHDRSTEIDFHERFDKMIRSYSTQDQKVIPTKYTEDIWENISQSTKSELFYVVREMLVNMKKHSEAKLVVLKFEKNDHALYINYTDNGKGIKNMDAQRGAGIRNTENRIDSIGGDITFEENPKGGLIIKITIPINSNYV